MMHDIDKLSSCVATALTIKSLNFCDSRILRTLQTAKYFVKEWDEYGQHHNYFITYSSDYLRHKEHSFLSLECCDNWKMYKKTIYRYKNMIYKNNMELNHIFRAGEYYDYYSVSNLWFQVDRNNPKKKLVPERVTNN